ncbi:type II toxin-antitoxin system HipA family toxin [Xanthomonas cerealis pv. cerealis]|uniref:Type II toxin-antitoxin system HipA family toxin n=1 Tax=Xanthomonas cerealis pv. cerealis TaxID=152263 RepID=A0A514ECD1_9XANT|nr:type II toxin-antitoxin system HipA family toxin [Xanthomonas translucens]QDI03433.1 type II toxin-antitoxin system HipA family toxin [Xanthomonas translucens pv. cerealis]
MAVFKHVELIEVLIWGSRVGAVAADPALGAYVFEYDPKWQTREIDLAPFMMLVSNRSSAFVFPGLARETYMGLPGLLSDALPDRFGNQLIDAWMAQHGYSVDQVSTLDRLAYMSKRSMGALEFRPSRGGQRKSLAQIEMGTLVDAARRAVQGTLADEAASKAALSKIISVGTSAGGARAKAVLGWNPSTNELVSGQFEIPDGFEHWLLKFDGMGVDRALGPSQQYGRIEYAYSLMAGAAGVVMSPCQLLEENGRAHFFTKRFDRNGNEKVHVQSLCAMRHLDFNLRQTHAYETLFLTAAQLHLGDAVMTQLFRRMAFNVAGSNRDDHTKNFAFTLAEGGRWELAPAYDITFAFDSANIWLANHLMSIDGKFDAITRKELMAVAARFSIPGAKDAIEDVIAAVASWPEFAKTAGVGTQEIKRIDNLQVRL